VACLSLAVLCLPAISKATIIFNNLTGPGAAIVVVEGGDAGFERTRAAVGFTIVNNDQSGSFTFTIKVNNPGNSPVLLSIVSDDGIPNPSPNGLSSPTESVVFSLSSASAPSGFYKFTGAGTLTANTKYWVVASAGSTLGDSFEWVRTGSYDAQHNTSATFYGFRAEQGDGTPNNFTWGTIDNVFPGLEIDVTPVPEISHSGALAALFLLTISLGSTLRGKIAAKIRSLFGSGS